MKIFWLRGIIVNLTSLGNWTWKFPFECWITAECFKKKVISNHRAAQWILINSAPFNRIAIFSGRQTAVRSLSCVMIICRLIRKPHRCLNGLSGRFRVSLVSVPRRSYIPGKYRAANTPPELVHLFRNPRQLIYAIYLGSFGTPTYPGTLRSYVPMPDLLVPRWIKGAPTKYSNLIAMSLHYG